MAATRGLACVLGAPAGAQTLSGAGRDAHRTPSSAPSGDTEDGTLDVECFATTDAVSTHIEISHPLDSGDAGRDIAVGIGRSLAFSVVTRLPTHVDSFYPGPSAGVEAQILVAPAPRGPAIGAVAGVALACRVARRRTR